MTQAHFKDATGQPLPAGPQSRWFTACFSPGTHAGDAVIHIELCPHLLPPLEPQPLAEDWAVLKLSELVCASLDYFEQELCEPQEFEQLANALEENARLIRARIKDE